MSVAYIRAIRGPVMLITIGVLMLIDQHSSIGIGTTWPILLVVAGLMVLAERASIKENPWAAPVGGGGVYTPPPASQPQPHQPAPSAFRRFGETGEPESSSEHRGGAAEGGPRV